jgi:titin
MLASAIFGSPSASTATTFTVTSTLNSDDAVPGDGSCDDGSGNCTLRAALTESNAFPGADVIEFDIPGPGPFHILVIPALPPLSDPVTIDGYTQPGTSPNTNAFGQATNAVLQIVIDGTGTGPSDDGLIVTGGQCTVRGLVIGDVGRVPLRLSSMNNVIEGNFLGTNVNGAVPRANGFGIRVEASNNRIGGLDPAARNVIGRSLSSGIFVASGAEHIQILGNFIGTNAGGSASLGHQFHGIDLRSSNNEIRSNLISGNGTFAGSGISVGLFGNGSGNVIQGNFIGTDATGTLPIGNNQAGIKLNGDSIGNQIGGLAPEEGNIIAFNSDVFDQIGGGVVLAPPPGVPLQNLIAGNSIHSNEGPGIDLAPFGVNPNDGGDGDSGPNGGQNYPVLLMASSGGGTTSVDGQLNSLPSAEYRLEFFSNPTCHSSGHGDGKDFLGRTMVTTDGSGNVNFATALNVSTPIGSWVTATATDAENNTSEFSACVMVTGATSVAKSTWGAIKAAYR